MSTSSLVSTKSQSEYVFVIYIFTFMLYDDATPISLSRENPWVKITNHFRK